MKKVFSLLLSMAMLFSMTAGIDLSAYADTSGDFEYSVLSDGTAEITDYTGSAAELIIPSVVGRYSISSIGDNAFKDCCRLTSVVIPESITKIGKNAFRCCYSLINAVISKGVTSIDDCAFLDCTSLTNIMVDSDNQYYASVDGNLYNKKQTELIQYAIGKTNAYFEVPNGVTMLGDWSFSNCRNLTNVTIPDSVTRIGAWAFSYCHNLSTIILPNSITSISTNAFYYCDELTIYGYTNSYADAYAKVWGISFVALDTPSCTHIWYSDIIKKATASKDGKIASTCSVCGETLSTTVIPKASNIKLSKTGYTYNGKVQKPGVTVKDSKGKTLKNGTDYTVSYANGRKNVGKYAVKVTFKGKYSGSKTLYFTITPKGTSLSKVTAGKKKFTVKWKKQTSQTTGYQMQYSTDKNFKKNNKTVTVTKNKTTSKTISKLKGKKKYYVRIRTYKTVKVNGKNTKIYSSWSKAKAVTTKK